MHYEKIGSEVRCIEAEIPFEVPDSWEWCRLSDTIIINPKNTLEDTLDVSFVPMTMVDDQFSNQHISDTRKWASVKSGFTHFQEGDIGLAKITPCFKNRKSVILRNLTNGYGAGTTELHILRSISEFIVAEYILWFVKSELFIVKGKQAFSGAVGQQRIGKEYVSSSLFPLPPYNEQQRIVDAISLAFTQIDIVEKDKSDLQSIISQAKSKILDLAIRGKLVPQDPANASASLMLERIRAEKEQLIKEGKIKREKNESYIFRGDDKSYYERIGAKTTNIDGFLAFSIPGNWEWCKLSSAWTLISGRDLAPTEYNDISEGIPYITGASNFENHRLIINRWTPSPKVISSAGDLLITCKGTIGELLINEIGDVHIARQIMALRNDWGLFMTFFKYTVMFFIAVIQESAHGVIPGISREDLLNIYLPIPPLGEQHRIASAIEAAFSQLDAITDALV